MPSGTTCTAVVHVCVPHCVGGKSGLELSVSVGVFPGLGTGFARSLFCDNTCSSW